MGIYAKAFLSSLDKLDKKVLKEVKKAQMNTKTDSEENDSMSEMSIMDDDGESNDSMNDIGAANSMDSSELKSEN